MIVSQNNPLAEFDLCQLVKLAFHFIKTPYKQELHEILSLTTEKGQHAYLEALESAVESAVCANSFLEKDRKDSFLDNIIAAWEEVEKEYINGEYLSKSKAIALQLRYALITSSFRTFANDYSDELLVFLAKNKRWKAEQCLAYISQRRNDDQEFEILAKITPYYPEKLLSKVLKLAESIDSDSKVWAIIELLTHFPENQRLKQLCLDNLSLINDLDYQVDALTSMAKAIPDSDDILLLALEKVNDIKEELERVSALEKIASLAPKSLIVIANILKIIKELSDLSLQIESIEKVLPYVDDVFFPEFITEVTNSMDLGQDEIYLASQFANILAIESCNRKPEAEERFNILAQALSMVSLIPEPKHKAKALIQIGPYLPNELLLDYLAISNDIEENVLVLWAVRDHISANNLPGILELLLRLPRVDGVEAEIQEGFETFGRIYEFIKHIVKISVLPVEVWFELLDVIKVFPNQFWIYYVFAQIAHLLPDELQEKTREVANSIDEISIKDLTFKIVAKRYPEILPDVLNYDSSLASSLKDLAIAYPNNQELLNQALNEIRISTDYKDKTEQLVELALNFTHLVPEALECVKRQKEEIWRNPNLDKLIPVASADLLDEILIVARAINNDHLAFLTIIKNLIVHAPQEFTPEIFDLFSTLYEDSDKQEAICLLCPHLPIDLFPLFLNEIDKIHDEYYKCQALNEVIISLKGQILPKYLTEILLIVRSFKKPKFRAKLLRKIANFAPDVWSEAVRDVRLIENVSEKVKVLTEFLSFSPSLRQEMLEIALGIEDRVKRALALVELVPYEQSNQLINDVFQIVNDISDMNRKERVLEKLLPYLSNSVRQQLLPKVLKLTLLNKDNKAVINTGIVLPYLSSNLFEQLLDDLEQRNFTDDSEKKNFIMKLNFGAFAEYVPEKLMIRTLKLFSENGREQVAYEKIAPRLPETFKSEALDIALGIKKQYIKTEVLKILARVLPENLILRTLEAVASMEGISQEERALLCSSIVPEIAGNYAEYFYYLWRARISSYSYNRQSLLEEINNLIPIMKQLWGDEVITETIQTVKWILYTFP
ncbi:hypothetical protein H6F47_01220 [Sphaerospermopsis sp. FACHB-1094]|uniref:Apoptotic protease-activating factor 1 like protein n=1 Tax=Sphaerospermopsis reniformis TaxID=531300 RepID=A0A480A3D9_9CYAN|nr:MULTISPECIES: hypothetical protein [Sphaerospermopsis]MBD2131117.1 hypothetical protein [Sphaerospermopsis sp. FACHB-1094]GCL39387.1 apoptotic protease-activating factor 1 like protein [Sphaerospermopsis reniformis]